MTLHLTTNDRALLDGAQGPAVAMAMRILTESARLLGAEALVPIVSAHIDGCLYHGDSGTLFAERLVEQGARVAVPSTLNVGALDLLHGGRVRLEPHQAEMARRMMAAYVAMGCRATWTCAPYQAGHRPRLGEHVAWGESNAVAFCNSVLGARTNRYGDFLDICCAIAGRAPCTGLHIEENRRATLLIDASALSRRFLEQDVAWPILGAWLGRIAGDAVAAFDGLGRPGEDQLKALGAAAASSGAVGLFHVIGATPEAPTRAAALGQAPPREIIRLDAEMLRATRAALSTATVGPGERIQAVAIGSPHLSAEELRGLDLALEGRRCRIPLYACTSRASLAAVEAEGVPARLQSQGVVVVADTCIVVTPILADGGGALVTNSGKFAHYTPSTTGYEVVFASLSGCVESAVSGTLNLEAEAW